MIISLNGASWKLTGLWKNHWMKIMRDGEFDSEAVPAVGPVPATVPGAVQADLINARLLKDFNIGLDSMADEWVDNREWLFEREFTIAEENRRQKCFLCFDGLDQNGKVWLNDKKVSGFHGMFIPLELDITGLVKYDSPNILRVIFFQSPEIDGMYGFSNRISQFKARFNYIWDWCPRIVPVGIWEDVYLKAVDYVRITDFQPAAKVLEGNTGSIDIKLELDAHCPASYELRYTIQQDGRTIAGKTSAVDVPACRYILQDSISVEPIELWWPNLLGGQPLYIVSVQVCRNGTCLDEVSKRVGFRTVEFLNNPGSPSGALPYTASINGRRVFLRGVDWVPISPLYGSVTKAQYKHYLTRFAEMNCNILRVWGGSILEKKDFYDLCDELGLMVWQEFPQSSSGINNSPPEDPAVLEELEKVARSFVRRRRYHASHIIWCGGNELMWEDYSPINIHHLNPKRLKKVVMELDREKYFLPCSASGPVFVAKEEDFGKGIHHDVHGPWNYIGEPDHYRFFNGDDALIRTETGCPGISRLEALERYKGEYSLWPPDRTNPYWVHRGSWWLQLKQLTELFGSWDENGADMAMYVKASRYLQAESLRYAAEATRRREPTSSGFIVWMGNEPFPNNTNTSLVEYDGTPKPAYYWVRNAFSALHVSARYEKIQYRAGEMFQCGLVLHADSDPCAKRIELRATIQDLNGAVLHTQSLNAAVVPPVVAAGSVEWHVQQTPGDVFFLQADLYLDGEAKERNWYLFTTSHEEPFAPVRRLPACELVVRRPENNSAGEWLISNASDVAAVGVFLVGISPADFVSFSDNYFTLMPGETRRVAVHSDHPLEQTGMPFKIEALNFIGEA